MSFYRDFVLVQFSTLPATTSAGQDSNLDSDLEPHADDYDAMIADDTMFVTLVAKNDTNTQILLDMMPHVRSFVANKFS